MPTGDKHKSKRVNRILIVGDPGSAKTTAIGHLLEHGQELFVADFDDGLDPIFHFVPKQFHDKLHYETLVDPVTFDTQSGYPRVNGVPTAFKKFVALTKEWKDSETGESFGSPENWPDNRWFVIDGATGLGRAAFYLTLHFNNRMGKMIRDKDWGDMLRRVEGVPQLLQSYPINTIMISHLAHLTERVLDEDDSKEDMANRLADGARVPTVQSKKRYPTFGYGQKLPPRIGGYFNIVIQAKTVGSGARATRVLTTRPEADVDVKLPLTEKELKDVEVPITELYRIIKLLRGEK